MHSLSVLTQEHCKPRSRGHWLRNILWITIWLVPLMLWNATSDIFGYYKYSAPAGQIWYLYSKLFGLYAALGLWYQMLSTLLKNTGVSFCFPSWKYANHRYLGSFVLLTICAHILCFFMAKSVRKQELAWSLFLPNFDDFYHTAITVGLFAFFVALVAIGAAILRNKIPKLWRLLHQSMVLVVGAGLIHGLLIGTETRYGFFKLFYFALILSFVASVLYRVYPYLRAKIV